MKMMLAPSSQKRTAAAPAVKVATQPGGLASDGYMDKKEVGRRLGLRPRTVGVWVLQGKLPAYRFGRRLRFKWAEIEQHLGACRTGQPRREAWQ